MNIKAVIKRAYFMYFVAGIRIIVGESTEIYKIRVRIVLQFLRYFVTGAYSRDGERNQINHLIRKIRTGVDNYYACSKDSGKVVALSAWILTYNVRYL